MTKSNTQLREAIAELTKSRGQTIDNDSRVLVPVAIDQILAIVTTATSPDNQSQTKAIENAKELLLNELVEHKDTFVLVDVQEDVEIIGSVEAVPLEVINQYRKGV